MIKTSTNPQRWISKGRKVSKSISHKDMYVVEDLRTGQFHIINTAEEVAIKMWPPDSEEKAVGGTRKYGVIIADEHSLSSSKRSALQVEAMKEFLNTKSL